ncbi:MAG: molybdopterin-dependent oxidoreductase [Dehalococcoidia bacterium]|nr:molybdopterin-dependent oxidoreductase [Dehalococcoidia bacterium]
MAKSVMEKPSKKRKKPGEVKEDVWMPTYCWLCAMGPCMLKVRRVDGVAVNVQGNLDDPEYEELARNKGRICPKPYSLIEKVYNPHRLKGPMKRTNPQKGKDIDPGWVEITWDEALDTIAQKLKAAREKNSMRVCTTLTNIGKLGMLGTWLPFYLAFGPMQDLRGGSSVRCGLGVHSVGQTIHGGFRCSPDMTYNKYLLVVGSNIMASGGVPGNLLYPEAKKVVVDPVFNLTASKAERWLPIKPGTDTAFLLSLINVIIHELKTYDREFLKEMTVSPYLVGPDGNFVLDKDNRKALVWDMKDNKAKTYDAPGIKEAALEGVYSVDGTEAPTAFQALKDHVAKYTAEWASGITTITAQDIRTVARELVDNARIGSTIQIDGVTLPYRPVDIVIGRPVETDVNCYQNILCQHILVSLLGALEVVGGHKGGTAERNVYDFGITPGGANGTPKIETYPFTWPPVSWDAAETLLPFHKIWGHPYHLVFRNLVDPPKDFPMPPPPEVYLRWRDNAMTSTGDPELVEAALKKIPFIASITYVMDELTQLADIVIPDHTELERYEIAYQICYRLGSGREFKGTLLRQPIIEPVVDSRDISDICTELAARIGILDQYNNMFNIVYKITDPHKLEAGKKYEWKDIIDRICLSLTDESHGLEWFAEHGALLPRLSVQELYSVYHKMKANKMRYPLPYMEHVKKVGEELAANLERVGIKWWPTDGYTALPEYKPSLLTKLPEEYDFFVTSSRIPIFVNSINVDCPRLIEVAQQVPGQQEVVINAGAAEARGIKEGDEIWLESPLGKVKGKVTLSEGIRPDTILIASNYGQYQTPVARDTGRTCMNALVPINYEWTDRVSGTMQATIKVKIYKA